MSLILFFLVYSEQSEMKAVRNQLSDAAVQPLSEQQEEDDEEEEEDEDEDEEWAWHSGDLTKRYNRTSLNCQVRQTPITYQ